jgi:hypothetical protein
MRKIIKLTEGDLHRIVKESVARILNEAQGDERNIRNRTLRYIQRIRRGDYDKRFQRGDVDFIFDIPYIDTDEVYNEALKKINGEIKRRPVHTNPWNEPFDQDMGWH